MIRASNGYIAKDPTGTVPGILNSRGFKREINIHNAKRYASQPIQGRPACLFSFLQRTLYQFFLVGFTLTTGSAVLA